MTKIDIDRKTFFNCSYMIFYRNEKID